MFLTDTARRTVFWLSATATKRNAVGSAYTYIAGASYETGVNPPFKDIEEYTIWTIYIHFLGHFTRIALGLLQRSNFLSFQLT